MICIFTKLLLTPLSLNERLSFYRCNWPVCKRGSCHATIFELVVGSDIVTGWSATGGSKASSYCVVGSVVDCVDSSDVSVVGSALDCVAGSVVDCVVSVVCVVGREVGRVVAVGTTVASKGRGPVQVAGRGGM